MDTQRFDALTVALSRGGSRRNVLRGLVGGVLGAVALGQSGALAQKDEAKPDRGGGRPVTNPARPVCPAKTNYANCPLCAEARFGVAGTTEVDGTAGCCDPTKGERHCEACEDENALYCSTGKTINNGYGTCVTVTCTKEPGGKLHCDYRGNNVLCQSAVPGSTCCGVFTSPNFGHCVMDPATTCQQV